MHLPPLTPLLLAAGATAQTTGAGNLTTTFFNLMFGTSPLASVIAASPSPGPTTYLLWCGDDYASDGYPCDWPSPGLTITAGPSTFAYTQAIDTASVTISITQVVIDCTLEGTTRAVCTRPNDVPNGSDPGATLGTATATADTYAGEEEVSGLWGTLVVTAGAEKLAEANGAEATATTATSGAGATGSGAAAAAEEGSGTGSRTATPTESAAASTGAAVGAAAAATSTNAAGRFDVPFSGAVVGAFIGILAL